MEELSVELLEQELNSIGIIPCSFENCEALATRYKRKRLCNKHYQQKLTSKKQKLDEIKSHQIISELKMAIQKKDKEIQLLEKKLIIANNQISTLKKNHKQLPAKSIAIKYKSSSNIIVRTQKKLYTKTTKNAKLNKIKQLETMINNLFAPIKALNKINKNERSTAKQEALRQGLLKYFKRNPKLFESILIKMDKGKFLQNLRHETIKSVQQALTPAVALAIKYRLKLSDKKYEKLKKILKGSYDFLNECYIRKIYLKEGEYNMPVLFPSLKKVKDLEEKLKTLNIENTSDGKTTTLTQWLEMAFKVPALVEAMNLSNNCLEIKLGGDGFRMTRATNHVNIYFTLFNLGTLIHSPAFVFTLVSLKGKESKELLRNNLQFILQDLSKLHEKGIDVTIKNELKHLNVDTYLCCDYGFTCNWLGLSATSRHFCYLCTVDRKSEEMIDFNKSSPLRMPINNWKVGQCGVQDQPISTIISLDHIMICSIHMFCALFGRLILILENVARTVAIEEIDIITKCNNWFKENHFCIEFKQENDMTIKVTGTEVKRFLKLRKQFYKLFTMYNMENEFWITLETAFQTFEWLLAVGSAHEPKKSDVEQFEKNALEFLNLLKAKFFPSNLFKDYEHLLAKHVPEILKKHGSLGKFSTQAFEHKNKVSKQIFQQCSSKGGGYNKLTREFNQQLINHNEIEVKLHFHTEVAESFPNMR